MMSPAEHMRFVLIECRRRGWSFGEAWMAAIQSLPRPQRKDGNRERREWLSALAWSRPFYQAAYDGDPFGDTPALAELDPAGSAAA